MPYNKNQVPDAPLPVSMLPRVVTPTSSDLFYAVQPGNQPGNRSRALQLGVLLTSNIFKTALQQLLGTDAFNAALLPLLQTQDFEKSAQAAAAPKFYEFTYDGALPRNGIAPGGQGVSGLGTRIAYLEVPFKHQAIFWIDGYSDTATSYLDPYDDYIGNYTYGLRLTARSLWSPHDDEDHDIFFPCMTGRRVPHDDPSLIDPKYEPTMYFPNVGEKVPYTARGQWWLHNPAHGADIPDTVTKELSLFAFGGKSNNPYQAQDPANYHLNIHVLVFPDHKYDFPAG